MESPFQLHLVQPGRKGILKLIESFVVMLLRSLTIALFCLPILLFSQPLNGLIARYSFNGGNVIDDIGSNNAITNGASPGTDRTGQLNSALFFDGTQSVNIGPTPSFEFGLNDFSYSLWFRCDSVQLGMLVVKTNPSTGFACFIGDSMNLTGAPGSFLNILNLENSTHRGIGIPITMGEWHHLVVVHEYAQSDRFYVDNTLIFTDFNAYDGITGLSTAGMDFRIGAHSLGNFYVYKGWIDDLHVYNRILDGNEVAVLYNLELSLNLTSNPFQTMRLFPNPVKNEINVIGLSKETPYALVSQEGRIIQTGTVSDGLPIPIEHLPNGHYFLKLENQYIALVK
jgi:hypothetical protein